MSIHPRDQAIFHTLASLEEAGEKGFSAYYSGDIQTGSQEMQKSVKDSQQHIKMLQDPELKKQAKELLEMANRAIREYMKNPSEDALNTLKSDVDAYKDFLDEHQ